MHSPRAESRFKGLVGEVSIGEVGIIIGLEISRIARNNADFFPLVEMCALTGTLVADEEGIYDPKDPNDRLILGVKSTVSEAELHGMRVRLQGARWSLARRGELRRKIPVGYVWDERRRVVMDPDERVRSAVACLFGRFEEIGSANGLARWYRREGLIFPRRDFRGRWDGPVEWKPLSVRTTNQILHNPFYAGAYFYGRHRAVTGLDPETKSRKTVLRLFPLESWEVLIQDAHPAYLSWDQFVRNQEHLKENRRMPEGAKGAVGSGAALLAGIVHCLRCGRQMGVVYAGDGGYPVYTCRQNEKYGGMRYCQSVSATQVDRWVGETILEALKPKGIEAALAAVEELERRSQDLRRQWEQRLEQAEYECHLARKRYQGVDPENRLVAANLERDWEEKLRSLEDVRKEYAERSQRPPMQISEADRLRLGELARDLPRLWRAKSTKHADRKRVVRILVREVWLSKEKDRRVANVLIRWHTGATSEAQVPTVRSNLFQTPDSVVKRAQELQAELQNYEKVADQLNREALKTGRGNSFTVLRVKVLLRRYKIALSREKPEDATFSNQEREASS